jgi:hypothetical protein
MPKGCFLCRLFLPFARRQFDFDPIERVWKISHAWDCAHSNKWEILRREADRDALTQAFNLYASDPQAAFRLWLELAERGSVWSMFEVATGYTGERGVATDPGEAEKWFKRGFEAGDQRAMLECARMAVESGDYAAAEAILQGGVDQDWAPAMFWLAWYRHKQSDSRETYRNVRPLLEAAGQQGHPAAQMMLGRFMAKGKFGILHIPAGWKQLRRVSGSALSTPIAASE